MLCVVHASSLPRWLPPLWICSLNRCVREGEEPDARRGRTCPRLDSRAAAEGGIGSSPTKFLTLCLFRWAGLHLLSTGPLNGSKLRVNYLLQLLYFPVQITAVVLYLTFCVSEYYQDFIPVIVVFRLLVTECWGEQCAVWSSWSLQEGAVKSIFQRNGSVSATGCLRHLRNAHCH